jgi:hypothetical protein
MHEALWDLGHIKERREEVAREVEGIRLAGSLRGNKGLLRGLVARLFREPESRGLSRGCSGGAKISGEAGKETSPTTSA